MTQRCPSLLCLDTMLIGNPMTSLSALIVINSQAIPFVVFVGAFLRFLITDSPCHECAVSLLLSVKSLRLLFTYWVECRFGSILQSVYDLKLQKFSAPLNRSFRPDPIHGFCP